jgi:hypothetical protein
MNQAAASAYNYRWDILSSCNINGTASRVAV